MRMFIDDRCIYEIAEFATLHLLAGDEAPFRPNYGGDAF